MTTPNHYLYELRDGVGIVTLNRPERLNAVSWELAADLVKLFTELRDDEDVRTILLTGAGKAFCAGGDADFVSGAGARPLPGLSDPSIPMKRSQRKTPGGPFAAFTKALIDVEKPVIAAIHCACVGAGLAYALACDRRFADSTAKLSAIFVKRGFSPDCGVPWFLPRIVPLPVALQMVETGKMFGAEEAKSVGLVDELVPEGKDFEAAFAYAKELATGPSVAIDLGRRFIHKALTSTLDEMLDYECVASTMTSSTRDAKEGVASILEKRKPEWKGF
ncbi:MAG: enoyl-CoA hydratase/isomerase family protein [Deltaproteobacteria bacterium]|nr:enoyl-CoA hydratase/isomerase family protein [Deltaproteobacteria bacterium]